MEIPRHWRLRKIRYGNPEAWGAALQNWQELNPRMGLAQILGMSREVLEEVHDRVATRQKEVVVFSREET